MSETALNTLLRSRERFLAFVSRRVRSRDLAEDILQAAYMRALEKAPQDADEDGLHAWFFSVLRHAVIDSFRRSTSEAAAMDRWAFELGPEEPAAVDPFAPKFLCGCIQRVLPTMRPAYAEILREVDLNERPLNEYANAHNLTPNNAAVRAHRARTALRKELERVCGSCSTQACLECFCKLEDESALA
ncbi:RNA polymerase sigma factor [Granulicella cerasi]|uniref:RNA polymerase sigma factor n=1 Tax=Granulicella cerasi TaxID=741063 RepID=A0ABW1ZAG3_9BACT|nr:sigma-70 family RNA polymerase sigma factor [Granulicella cerasi]